MRTGSGRSKKGRAGIVGLTLFSCMLLDSSSALAQQSSGNSPQSPGQEIRADNGSMFMEEVPEKRKTPRTVKPDAEQRNDFGSLGVPVDPNGKIIPIIQPSAGGVLQNSSRMEIEYTPPTVYVPYYSFAGPYGYAPVYSPYSSGWAPIYRPQYAGALAVPMGIPRYFSSDSANPASQQADFAFSGKYYNYSNPASVWSPKWNSPWGGGFITPGITEFQQQGTIRSIFPQNLNN